MIGSVPLWTGPSRETDFKNGHNQIGVKTLRAVAGVFGPTHSYFQQVYRSEHPYRGSVQRVSSACEQTTPSLHLEAIIAGHVMDASTARAAPKATNPVAADESNLIAGALLFRDDCPLCHGDPLHPISLLADSLNPSVPQFRNVMADMPENQNFHILESGIL